MAHVAFDGREVKVCLGSHQSSAVYTPVCTPQCAHNRAQPSVHTTVCTQCSQEVDRCVGAFFKVGRYCHICGGRSSRWIGLLTPLPIRRGTALSMWTNTQGSLQYNSLLRHLSGLLTQSNQSRSVLYWIINVAEIILAWQPEPPKKLWVFICVLSILRYDDEVGDEAR